MIDEANFANLKADIEKNGILEPILIFEGRILDGRNRYRAGKQVGRLTPAKFKMFEGSYSEAEAYVFSTNFLRRQMTAAQKQDVICKMLDKYPSESIRQIAKRCGTSHSYVQKIKDKLNEPSPEQKEFTAFCKTWDALSEIRRAEFVKSFAPDIRDLLTNGFQ
jgi:ParB-like chromosome segregation protein Spo0J